MPKVGAHVSAAVSLELSFDRAKEIGADCTQIFISPPQQWAKTTHGEEEIKAYLEKQNQSGIGPNFIHGTYLINLGTDKPENLQKSIGWLIYALDMAAKLKMTGVIFHTGSHGGRGFLETLPQIVKSINVILERAKRPIESSNEPFLILENAAGAGNIIGDRFSQLGQILKQIHSDRLRICLDTCHAFAEGYEIRTKEGLEKTLEEFDKEIGLENLVAIHANDAKFDLGSNKDRHENIGEGFIGTKGFHNIINHPSLTNLPFILEVPGFAELGPDQENIQTLKSLQTT